uniref:Uncharacterized protein n=1 Tax=Caenorhabditis japonica TaxID=281687 RepID=A0A8R1ERJ2_CAEJA
MPPTATQPKRKFSEVLAPDPPREFVAYADFKILVDHVKRLTEALNQIRCGILEDGSSKLIAKVAATVEQLTEMPEFGSPVTATTFDVFSDAPSTPAPRSTETPQTATRFPIAAHCAYP